MLLKFKTGVLPVTVGLAALAVTSARTAQAAVIVDQYDIGSQYGDTTGAGGIIDSVNGAHDGTLESGGTLNATSFTSATNNDTTNGFISLPTYTFASGAYTFEEFLTPSSSAINGYPVIFSFGNDEADFIAGYSGRGGTTFNTASSAEAFNDNKGNGVNIIDPSPAAPMTVGALNQVVVVVNGTDETLYLNGVQIGQVSDTVTPASLGTTAGGAATGITTDNAIGGNDPYGNPEFDGTISQFNVYQGALTPAQILADYEDGGAPIAPEPSQVSMLALMGLGLGGLVLKARKRSIRFRIRQRP